MSIRVLVAMLALALSAVSVSAQGVAAAETSFTYQGRLQQAGSPAQGKHTLTFRLFDQVAGGAELAPAISEVVEIEDGLFTVSLDYGLAALAGRSLFLEIEVMQEGGASQILSPRQKIRSAPVAAQSAAASLLDDGTIVLQRSIGGSEEFIYNARPDESFDDTSTADPFWQSFTPPTDAWIDFIAVAVKGVDDSVIPTTWTLHRGTGPLGEVIATGDSVELGAVSAVLGALDLTLDDPAPVAAGETYTFVVAGSDLSFTEIPIIDPNAGRSSSGPNVASFFFVSASTETVPATQILPNGTLQLKGSSPNIELEQSGSTNAIGIQSRHTTFSGFTQWEHRSFPETHQISFFPEVGPRQWLIALDGLNNRTGITARNPLSKLHIQQGSLILKSSAVSPNETVLIEHNDAGLGLYSNANGSFGSFLSFGETTPVGELVDKWSMLRRTNSGGAELQFTYGSDPSYSTNPVRFALRPNGSAWLQGALTQNSAADQKHDIETLTDAIDTLLKMRGVSYTWNHTDKPDIGFLADEMAEVLPEIVGFDDAGKPIGIDYGRVTALIVEATKAQQRQIEDLLRRVEALEAKD